MEYEDNDQGINHGGGRNLTEKRAENGRKGGMNWERGGGNWN